MNSVTLSLKGNITPNKGNIVYEYSPLKNLYNTNGELSFFDTEKLNFRLSNPVEVTPQFSYDGSVNLILDDNLNAPKLINSRFKLLQNNTYEIPFRLNEKPTNVYEDSSFRLSTNLQKQYDSIPRIELNGIVPEGNLKVGNYIFYIKYSDSDGNTTDIAAESGIVSCFIGYDKQPKTISGGYRDENAYKSIILNIKNLDLNYNYIKIYYSRYTGDIDQNRIDEIYEIVQLYKYNGDELFVKISGYETTEEVTKSNLNLYNISINSAKTQTICQNRLFLGNIKTEVDDIRELRDISLRFCPYIISDDKDNCIGNVSTANYNSTIEGAEYYSTQNIYNKVGYWNEEIYRFGIVYIYDSGRLSNVYNVRGIKELSDNLGDYTNFPVYDEFNVRKYLNIDDITGEIKGNSDENCKGVFRICCKDSTTNKVYSIGFANKYLEDCKTELEKLNIKGFFFVRQKRIPTILAQTVLIPEAKTQDEAYAVRVPLLPVESENNAGLYPVERFLNDEGTLVHNYDKRLFYTEKEDNVFAGVCPEYNLNQPYYEQIFTGANLPVKRIGKSGFIKNTRHYYLKTPETITNDLDTTVRILGVPDNTSARAIDNTQFRGICGSAAEAFRIASIYKKTEVSYNKYKYAEGDNPVSFASSSNSESTIKNNNFKTNTIRGIFGSHLVMTELNDDVYKVGDIINIYIPNYNTSEMSDYFKIRYQDDTSYYSVGHRYKLSDYKKISETGKLLVNNTQLKLYRGDCYICNYTVRIMRNFSDSSDPINDIIVDDMTWRKSFNTESGHIETLANINRSDVNAVKIGSWITVKVCCSRNLSLRSEDKSYPSEKSLYNSNRTFYPLTGFNINGNGKIPESNVLNDGFGITVGDLTFNRLNNQIYINNSFKNRIVYSNINSDKEYLNSLRLFPESNFRDYHIEFGSLTKLVTINSNLIAIFEHGIVSIPVKEKVAISNAELSEVFLNSQTVLPETATVLSSEFGSQWKDSIIKTLDGKIYGVDTTAKKIWVVNSSSISIISDMVVSEFLNNNIPLSEHQFEEIIGIQNVKTHYNAFKDDIMFTFYVPNKLNKNKEVVWNLCYNNTEKKFVTFYSWVPLESNNINNEFYSFDRKSSKKYLNSIGIEDYNTYNSFISPTITETTIKLNNKIYKHGFGGIINNAGKIKPCMWYDEQHPFEFEVIVNENPAYQKVFNNLKIVSNKAEPESFHYEIIGESYDFKDDKETAYYRQEAKRELFSNLGSDMVYDDAYADIEPNHNIKSFDLPLYYMRVDRGDKIEDDYLVLVGNNGSYDYSELSGTEIIHYDKLQEFRLQEHVKAVDITKQGRLRGNMHYLGDYWNIQINPILITEKNETWTNNLPPITLLNVKLPEGKYRKDITVNDLPKQYQNMGLNKALDTTSWGNRSELKLKDKWVKVRIRYSGKQLALISLLQTMYQITFN